jgi:UDP-N-acetylmuramate dehydrogenase
VSAAGDRAGSGGGRAGRVTIADPGTTAVPIQLGDGSAIHPADLAVEIGRELDLRARVGEPLAGHTTMRVGGPADVYVAADTVDALVALVRYARARAMPYWLLGRGSDVVVADAGVRGLVVHVRCAGWRLLDGARLEAEAGLPLARAATVTAAAGLAGLEFGLAIPGNVGGAVWANAGAHGSDVAAVLERAVTLAPDGREREEDAATLGFGYRESRLKHPAPGARPEVVLSATFRLTPDDPAAVAGRLAEIRRWRRANQPLGIPSAGSVFRNPPGASAGALIDSCGLKGRRIGGAVVSERHANWILNDRGARAADVRRLTMEVRAEVAARTGVLLVPEVVFAGDWAGWEEAR